MQEAYIQRDMTAGDVRRVQKEYRVLSKLLKEMTAHNKKFLLIRDTILPELKAWMKQKEDNIKANSHLMLEGVYIFPPSKSQEFVQTPDHINCAGI